MNGLKQAVELSQQIASLKTGLKDATEVGKQIASLKTELQRDQAAQLCERQETQVGPGPDGGFTQGD